MKKTIRTVKIDLTLITQHLIRLVHRGEGSSFINLILFLFFDFWPFLFLFFRFFLLFLFFDFWPFLVFPICIPLNSSKCEFLRWFRPSYSPTTSNTSAYSYLFQFRHPSLRVSFLTLLFLVAPMSSFSAPNFYLRYKASIRLVPLFKNL